MGALSHILESNGIATTAILPSPDIAERMRPPRALIADFPLGRPLGRPGDSAFQRRVVEAALSLLARDAGPVLEVFPEVIADEAADPLACPLPPRHDPDLPPAVDEARALAGAVEAGVSTGIHGIDVPRTNTVAETLFAFDRLARGAPWREAGLPRDILGAARGVLAYYQQAALGLVDRVPAARSAESWYVRSTEAGRTMRAAQRQLKEQGAPHPLWFYLLPATQE